MRYCHLDSPVGPLLLAGDDRGLHCIEFIESSRSRAAGTDWIEDAGAFAQPTDELREYFAGERREFTLRLAPHGTPFQQRVWQELCLIPYGETWSYGELASRIGQPSASRAVGLANGRNPLPIVIPCHRVIGANGSLTGYGGGLPIKQQLLALERGGSLPFGRMVVRPVNHAGASATR
jgi:methylated-DNA-[protein]-cysteine S-methyltransferase